MYRSSCLLNLTTEKTWSPWSRAPAIYSLRQDKCHISGPQQEWQRRGAGKTKMYPNASETCQDPPNSVGMTLITRLSSISGLFFHNKKPKYQRWQTSECYFRGEREEKEELTTKPAKKTKVKTRQRNEKGRQPGERIWKPEAGRAETVERDIGKGTEEKDQDADRTLHWTLISCDQEFPLKTISY